MVKSFNFNSLNNLNLSLNIPPPAVRDNIKGFTNKTYLNSDKVNFLCSKILKRYSWSLWFLNKKYGYIFIKLLISSDENSFDKRKQKLFLNLSLEEINNG